MSERGPVSLFVPFWSSFVDTTKVEGPVESVVLTGGIRVDELGLGLPGLDFKERGDALLPELKVAISREGIWTLLEKADVEPEE